MGGLALKTVAHTHFQPFKVFQTVYTVSTRLNKLPQNSKRATMPKITNSFVSKLPFPVKGQVFYRDSSLPGFGLRVTPGSRTYIVEARVNGIVRRIKLGDHKKMTAAIARARALKLLAQMAVGKDPTAEKAKKKIATVTLQEVLDHYISVRSLRPNSRRTYLYILPRCLGDWMELPVTSISREMVEQRHHDLRKPTRQGTSGEAQANTVMRILGTLLNFAAANYEIDGKPIILVNPIKRLSNNRQWYQDRRRQTVIPDHKLVDWYNAVMSLRHAKVRDYLLLLLLTGLRRNEAASLEWRDIDFQARVLTIRAELSKNKKEHRLPLSTFLEELLKQRYVENGSSDYVFPGRGGKGHIVDSDHVIRGVAKDADCPFMIHDLRRTFLTMAERLGFSYVILKKLANHSGKNDTTFGYIVVDIERLREPTERITNEFLRLCKDGNGHHTSVP
jgi:integrase